MKKNRYILYFVITALIISFGIFYKIGFFHPTYFILDGKKINAPTETYLYSVSVNDNTVFDLFSPLKFSTINNYNLKPNEKIDILFFNPSNNKILNIIGEKSNLALFKKYILEAKKIETLTLQPKSYKYCKKIYQYNDEKIKSFLFFNSVKHINFLLSTNINEATDRSIKKLCEK